jgi:hypothetical protein
MTASSSRDDLLAEIRRILNTVRNPATSSASAANDLYEEYLWAVVIDAAMGLLGRSKVWLEDVHGNVATRPVLRTSPGRIWSVTHPYTHAVLDFGPGQELEAHVGIQVVGRSRVWHECDLAVLDRTEGTRCRVQQVPPRSSSVLLAAEAKFYATPLSLSLAREFIGLRSDVAARSTWFVANTSRPNLARLLVHRTQPNSLHADVVPGSLEHDDLVAHVRLVLRDYLAR